MSLELFYYPLEGYKYLGGVYVTT